MDYTGLPFITTTDTVTDENRAQYYARRRDVITGKRKEILEAFQKNHFCVSGVSHVLPEFLVSETAKKNLIYPQGFLLMEADQNYYTDRTDLASYELRYTLDGCGRLRYNGRDYILRPGDGYLIDCRKPHYYRTNGEKWTSTCLHFNGVPAAAIYRAWMQGGNVTFSSDTFPNFEMLQMQILSSTQKICPFNEYRISCLFDMLLTELLTQQTPSPAADRTAELLDRIIRYTQEHFTEPLSVDDLSRRFGLSRTYLSRKFREYTGFPPHAYILELRLNRARMLLRTTDDSVESVACACGFTDPSYFIQIFRKKEGITPLKYRC